MVDVTEFSRVLEIELDKKLAKPSRRRIADAARFAYDKIMRDWPKDTFFSGANNRVSITGRPIARVEPARRPEKTGALKQKFNAVLRSERAKILQVAEEEKPRKDRSIVLGNAVDYAPDVGRVSGRGFQIYFNALAAAQSRLRREQ